jgi:hypothetical protein
VTVGDVEQLAVEAQRLGLASKRAEQVHPAGMVMMRTRMPRIRTGGSGVTSQPAGLGAQRMVDALIATGLPAPKPRDNSKNCASPGCHQMLTTDAIIMMPFAAAADHPAQVYGDNAHQRGLIVCTMPRDGEGQPWTR